MTVGFHRRGEGFSRKGLWVLAEKVKGFRGKGREASPKKLKVLAERVRRGLAEKVEGSHGKDCGSRRKIEGSCRKGRGL